MPRWLNFALGLITLIVLAVGAIRALVRHMPDGHERWTYEAMVGALAVSFVVIVVRAARGYRPEKQDDEA